MAGQHSQYDVTAGEEVKTSMKQFNRQALNQCLNSQTRQHSFLITGLTTVCMFWTSDKYDMMLIE